MAGKRAKWPVLLATACLVFCSCGKSDGDRSRAAKTVRVACVGDSITFGAGIEKREVNSYPARLAGLLGDQWQVRNFGVNGATLLRSGSKPFWKLPAFIEALAFSPQVVIIALGTNDSQPCNWQHRDEFVGDYVALIRSFQALESKPRIWLCYPTPAFPGYFGIADKVIKEEVIPRIDETARLTGLPIIDLRSALRDDKEMFPDTIHPNARGASVIAQAVYAAITDHQPTAP